MSVRVEDLETPVATIDLDIMEENIRHMNAMIEAAGVRCRPHIKTHKIPEIAHQQLAAGAVGIACQKLGEAEVMVAAGIHDVLLCYNIIGAQKLDRLARLCHRANMLVVADSAHTVDGLAAMCRDHGVRVGVLVELFSGRCGVTSGADAVALARRIADAPGLEQQGLMNYPTSPKRRPVLAEAVDALKEAGLSTEIVSGGGTGPAYALDELADLVTEHRPGTYVFYDYNHVKGGRVSLDRCALRVRTTVVSRPTADKAILDGGSKTFTNDGGKPFHHILEYPDAVINGQNEEHGHVDLSNCKQKPEIGEVVSVVPNHACGTVNMHDEVVGVRGGEVEVIWPVLARGAIR